MVFDKIRRENEKTYFFTGTWSASAIGKAFEKNGIYDFEIWEHKEALQKLPKHIKMPDYVIVGVGKLKSGYSKEKIAVVVSYFNTEDLNKYIEEIESEGTELTGEQTKVISQMYEDRENGTFLKNVINNNTHFNV